MARRDGAAQGREPHFSRTHTWEKEKVQVLLRQGLSSGIPLLLQWLGPLSVSGKRQAGKRRM